MRRLLTILCIIGLSSCLPSTAPSASIVQFRLESPFCGPQRYTLRFSIDQHVVGTDTLSNGQTSQRYTTTPGTHALFSTVNGATSAGDTTVMLRADSTFTARANVYCS
jgi:hypothetical protein